MRKIIILLIFVAVLFVPYPALANLGVGVGTGKIIVDEPLRPGTIYNLPSLAIINTGDEVARFGTGVSHRENQEELKSESSWYSFKPETFELSPGQVQTVQVTLTVPIRAVPGKYFAFLEGHPVTEGGNTSVGIAAAAKLYFEVEPSNPLSALYYRFLSFWRNNEPYSSIVAGVILTALIVWQLRKNFHFKITKKN